MQENSGGRSFSSNDSLHERVVPLFLRANQTFVKGMELKADLGRLDQRYSCLPKRSRIVAFSTLQPTHQLTLHFL
jgi:hypothetical protein